MTHFKCKLVHNTNIPSCGCAARACVCVTLALAWAKLSSRPSIRLDYNLNCDLTQIGSCGFAYIWWSRLCLTSGANHMGRNFMFIYTLAFWFSVFFRFQLINPNPKVVLHAKLVSAMRWRANPIKLRTWSCRARITDEMFHHFLFLADIIFRVPSLYAAEQRPTLCRVFFSTFIFLWWCFHKQ